MPVRTVRVVITGRVQGVGFRAWTTREAEARHLHGWVRNRRDGTVEAAFSGDGDAVEAMIAACSIGPRAAAVKDVTVFDETDTFGHGFSERPTE